MVDLLMRYLRPFRRQLALVIGLLFAQSIANLYLPELNADIINNGVVKGDLDYIWRTGAVMILVTLLFGGASVAGAYWGARVAMGFGRDLRSAVFRQVQTFSQVEVNHFGTPSLITRNTNDVQQVQQFIVMALAMMISAPILAIGGAIMALRQDVPLSGMLLVIIPLMGLVIGSILRRAIPQFQAMQLKIDRINLVVREALSGVRVVRAFVRTQQEERRFDEANRDLTATALTVNRLFSRMLPSLMVIMNLSTVAALWFGAIRVDSGAMPIGNFTAFLQYIIQILFGVMMATIMFVMVPRAAVSAGRIQEVLRAEPSVRDPEVPAAPQRGSGVIEFRDVEFRYPGAEEPVLRGISFTARPGEITAIVGSTGSGKSTLVNLLTRFYDVTGGAVLLDGVDVRQLRRDDLWSRIGVIAQRALLFSGTVASNLRFGREDASDEELWRALDIAQGGFVRDMPGALEAQISQGGTNVSGGQRQRLAIARALVKRPDVYIFDDSFSALDVKTDARLRAALRREVAEATVLVVAQRVATIMQAHRIIVLDAGRIVGSGTHAELMTTCSTYREIVESQLAGSEVAA
jgi:ATP-binding cassette, subfamily B, multidrug efflux pump